MPNPLRILTFSQSKENETQGFCSLFADSAYTHLEHAAQGEFLSFLEQFSLVYENNTTQLLTIYTVQLTNTQQGQH